MFDAELPPQVSYNAAQKKIICEGAWTILTITPELEKSLFLLESEPFDIFDGQQLTLLDSAGAELLLRFLKKFSAVKILLNTSHQKLLSLVQSYPAQQSVPLAVPQLNWIARLGKLSTIGFAELCLYLEFIGRSVCLLSGWLRNPNKILWRNILRIVETSGFYGMPIIGLLSFLIGIVLAYQMGSQLQNYGANIFVVNLLGISILREFAPLMTAIIVAGRTGAAFTAELGTMKVNQELDALMTMGVKPTEYLVLPKIIGLVIALPLLSVWASFAGILGGMIVSKGMLHITFSVFLHQFQESVALKQLWIGLIKTPVFAFIIASIGCFQGIQVEGGAESVGVQTTRSVVQSLFLIIVADAFFSILLSNLHA